MSFGVYLYLRQYRHALYLAEVYFCQRITMKRDITIGEPLQVLIGIALCIGAIILYNVYLVPDYYCCCPYPDDREALCYYSCYYYGAYDWFCYDYQWYCCYYCYGSFVTGDLFFTPAFIW